ncbi:MAG: efflux RND transporter periplasmic adaptor subunit [Caldilineaceae bacterium]
MTTPLFKSILPQSLCALAIAASLSGCGNMVSTFSFGSRPTPTPIALPLPASNPQAATQNFTVTRGPIINYANYSGKVAPAVQEDLFFQQSGRLGQLLVTDGARVEAGDLIAQLETEMLELDLQSAQLTLDSARQQLAEAEESLQYDRQNAELALEIIKLRQADAGDAEQPVVQRQVQQAEIALQRLPTEVSPVLQINVQRAQLALDRIQAAADDARIIAPISGEIRFGQSIKPDRQIAVTAYEPVFQIVDLTSLQVELNLTRAQMEPLREGMDVTVSLPGQSDALRRGTITTLPHPFGSGNGPLALVTLQESDASLRFFEGSTVDVQIELARKDDALLLPIEALYGFSGQYFVRVVDGTAQRAVDVEIGIQNDQFAEILAGVDAGTVVMGRQE